MRHEGRVASTKKEKKKRKELSRIDLELQGALQMHHFALKHVAKDNDVSI